MCLQLYLVATSGLPKVVEMTTVSGRVGVGPPGGLPEEMKALVRGNCGSSHWLSSKLESIEALT